jgi:hypothetical protein
MDRTMEKRSIVKQHLLAMLVLFAILIFVSSKASATITICFADGSCFTGDGSCDGWCPSAPAYPTCAAAGIFNPTTDYISSVSGQAWIVHGGTNSAVASDNLMEFIRKMKKKYPAPNQDPKIQAKISEEFAEFEKKHDNHKVSAKSLKALSKETGLRIVYKEAKEKD